MIIAVASGKGGTGKTTVATSMGLALRDLPVTYLDCDVEAPNGHLFLRPKFTRSKHVEMLIPQVEDVACDACGRCAEVCQYHAIVVLSGQTLVFPQLCHGCGSCTWNCPQGAIREKPRSLGMLQAGDAGNGIRFARGILDIGEPMAVPVIRALKRWVPGREGEVVIRDAPPGTSCPVVETLRGADVVLLVTEPTPFGLHDLRLAVKVAREMNLPTGVLLNRDGTGRTGVEAFCRENSIPILMRIPLERRIGEACARGATLAAAFPEYQPRFRDLYTQLAELASVSGPSAGAIPGRDSRVSLQETGVG
jgi:MinD superfamily P-loop ATPase